MSHRTATSKIREVKMAIRYDKLLNDLIRNEVRNYNARLKRMSKQGVKRLPEKQYVHELKRRYNTKTELMREINRLRDLSKEQVVKSVETKGGAKVAQWQYTYAKTNRTAAKQFFEKEYERVEKRAGRFPGERMQLDTISAKINLLETPLEKLTQSQFRSVISTINEFATSPTQLKAQYRGFLSEVEWVMDKVGIEGSEKEKFFKKFQTLSPDQFLYAYDNNDLIGRIYALYRKDYGADEAYLNVGSVEDAKSMIEELMAQTDVMITEAKLNAD